MAVIKQSLTEKALKGAVVLDLGDLGREAERIVADARAEAQRILEHARAEAQKLIDQGDEVGQKQGYDRGYAEGLEQGRAQGRQEVIDTLKPTLETLVTGWNAALERWETDREELLLHAREDVLTFAFDLGRKVIGCVIQHDPAVVQEQLATALKMLSGPSSIMVRVHPEDKALIEDVMPGLLEQFSGCEHASVREDAAVSRGGCIVTTTGGEIDATIETQLARLAEGLLPAQRSDHGANGEDHAPPANANEDEPSS